MENILVLYNSLILDDKIPKRIGTNYPEKRQKLISFRRSSSFNSPFLVKGVCGVASIPRKSLFFGSMFLSNFLKAVVFHVND